MVTSKEPQRNFDQRMTSPSRRRLALGLMFASLGQAHLPARAELLATGAAVVSIVGGIVGLDSDAAMKRTLRKIARRLGEVIANQHTILNELRELKLLVVETAFISWRDAYARNLVSYDRLLQGYVSELEAANYRRSSRLERDLEQLSRDSLVTTLNIGQMDVWAFASFATGVATNLLTDRILQTQAQRIATNKASFVERLDIWLDPAREASLPAIIARTKAEVDRRVAGLDGRGRAYVIFDGYEVRNSRGPYCYRKAKTTLTVSGSFLQGFTGSESTTTAKYWECEEDRVPHSVLGPLALYRGEMSPKPSQVMVAPLADDVETIQVPVVPGFTPSGYAIVDDFNRERIAIYELMAKNAKQRILLEQIQEFRSVLT